MNPALDSKRASWGPDHVDVAIGTRERFAQMPDCRSSRIQVGAAGPTTHWGTPAAALLIAVLPFAPFAVSQKDDPQPLIGGQPAVVLHRVRTGDGTKPEFLSATVLPGRAMNLFQITAWIPGKGEIPLINSPSLQDAAKILGGPDDPYGTKNTSFGGAFLVPFANRIVGPISNDRKTLAFTWEGHPMELDVNWKGKKVGAIPSAIHGLILAEKAEDVRVTASGDKRTVNGVIHAGDFNGHWFSKNDITITIELERDAVIATVEARNVGEKPEPVGIGWHPYFNLPSGDRRQVRLHLPGDMRAEVNNYDDVFPTGELEPVNGTPYDFTADSGAPLNSLSLDDNWSHLKKATDGSTCVEITDPAAGYGIRIGVLTPHVNTIQVYAPADKPFVAIEPQFNINDPFGAEWKGKDNGMVTLRPGQSVTWKVKLTLFHP